MLNTKINILRDLFQEAINNIDAGNSNKTEEELDNIIEVMTTVNRGVKRISKAYACEHILHCSHSSFDKYIKLGLIPKGKKTLGFNELSWSEKDFDESVRYRIKRYNERKGL